VAGLIHDGAFGGATPSGRRNSHGQLRNPQSLARLRTGLPGTPGIMFTPTSSSWLNLVERQFAEVTKRCVRRGSHTAVRQS